MTGTEAVVFTLLSVREAADSVELAQCVHHMTATGQYLVRIRLVV